MLKQETLDGSEPPNEYRDKRCGFTPDSTVRVVGVTMGEDAKHRQRSLERAKAFQGPETSPPVKLVREPENKFDPGAVKVYVGTDVAKIGNETKWEFTHVGYLPRDMTIPVRNPSGQLITDGKNALATYAVWKVMDAISAGRAKGSLLVGCDFIAKAPGTSSWGLQIGLKHEI